MATPSAVILFFSLLILDICWAQDITVGVNDTRLVTIPANIWIGSEVYHPNCGGIRWIWGNGQSVSLTFTGTRVTINFLYAVDGWIGQVSLDGTNVTEVNTNKAGVAVTDCLPLTWTSDVLIPGNHTVSVASLDPNLEIQATWVNINSFVYTAASVPSMSTTISTSIAISTSTTIPGPSGDTTTSKHKAPKIGIIVGIVTGIVALLFLLICTLFLRQRRQSSIETVTLDTVEKSAANPMDQSFTGISGYNNPIFQDGTSRYEEQRIPLDSMKIMSPPTQAITDVVAYPELLPSPPSSTGQRDVLNRSTTESPVFSPPSILSQSKHLPPLPDFPDTGSSPQTSSASARDAPTDGLLSENQLSVLQRLAEWNIPGPALAAVVASLRSGGGHVVGESELEPSSSGQQPPPPRTGEDAPPEYDFKGY